MAADLPSPRDRPGAAPAEAVPPAGPQSPPSRAPQRPAHLRVGARGEAAAGALLEAGGCFILARNYRCPFGEIDLIALDQGVLAFVEVKTRSSTAWGPPRDAVTSAKRRKIARTASHYMLAHREQECAYRADIVEVALRRGAVAAVRHLKGAFSIEGELEKLSE
jgi:putative endonuclease